MTLLALGLNYQTAPVDLREQVAFDPASITQALRELCEQPGVQEAMILSTCNRTELYAAVAETATGTPEHWLGQYHRLTAAQLSPFLYRHRDDDAVRHMFRVATGLDSMVLGEPQILGQVKDAYQQAREAHCLGTPMERWLQYTFAVAKRVRTDTQIGAHTVSIAFTAVRMAEQMFADLRQASVLLIGAGETIELAARHLADKSPRRLIIANRTLSKAQELAAQHRAEAIALEALPGRLAEADIVISSTASPLPVVTRTMVEGALQRRRRRPMFMVDIAMPRDIEASVGKLADVYLYGIDDLEKLIDEHRRARENAAYKAQSIIDLQVERYMAWHRSLRQKNPIADLRCHAEHYRDEVLVKAVAMLERGKSPEEALSFLAHTLTNKLLHHPSARLREATLSGDTDLLQAAGRLYGLDSQAANSKPVL